MERELEQSEENERKWPERIRLLAESHAEKLKFFQADEDFWKQRLNTLATDHRTKLKDLWEIEQTWKKNIVSVAEEYAVKLESLRSQELALAKEINRLQHWYDTRVVTLQAKIDDMRDKFGLSSKAYDLKLKEFVDIQDKIKQAKKERAFRRANSTTTVSNAVINTMPNGNPIAFVDLASWQVPVTTFDLGKSAGASYDVLEGQAEAEKQKRKRQIEEQNDRVELRKLSEDEKAKSRCESAPSGTSLTSDDPLPDGIPLEDTANIKPADGSSSETSNNSAISEELQDSSGPRNSHSKFALLTRNPARLRVDIRAGPGLRLPRPLARRLSRSPWTHNRNPPRTPVRKSTTEGSQSDSQCPLCIDPFDLSDQSFQPCLCGYRVCMFCVNRIRTMENGLCPACRAPYNDETIKSLSKAIGFDELRADQAFEAQPETEKEKTPVRGNDQRQRRKTIEGRALAKVHCYRCNNLGHYANECLAKNMRCSSCGLRGHMSHECKTQHWSRKMGPDGGDF